MVDSATIHLPYLPRDHGSVICLHSPPHVCAELQPLSMRWRCGGRCDTLRHWPAQWCTTLQSWSWAGRQCGICHKTHSATRTTPHAQHHPHAAASTRTATSTRTPQSTRTATSKRKATVSHTHSTCHTLYQLHAQHLPHAQHMPHTAPAARTASTTRTAHVTHCTSCTHSIYHTHRHGHTHSTSHSDEKQKNVFFNRRPKKFVFFCFFINIYNLKKIF